jgi:hypothetical protein
MKALSRPPTTTEQIIGAILLALAALAFGAVAVFVLTRKPILVPAAAIFSVLFLASATMFFRATFTARRSPSHQEIFGLTLTLLVGGVIGTVAAVLWGSGLDRLILLGSSLSAIASGLAGLSRRSR